MATEIIIGKCAGSPIKIPADRDAVSGQHVKITVSDDGFWRLDDLNSTNGTFIRDENGDFHRIYTRHIQESDIIRLGNGGANSFIFTAHKALHPEDNYTYEFRQLKKQLLIQKEKEAKKEKRIELNGWLAKLSGLGMIALCAIIGSINGVSINPDTRYILIASAPVVVGLLFNGDAKSLKALKKKREKVLTCPKCGRPVSEYDIEQGQCSRCKAK